MLSIIRAVGSILLVCLGQIVMGSGILMFGPILDGTKSLPSEVCFFIIGLGLIATVAGVVICPDRERARGHVVFSVGVTSALVLLLFFTRLR
jgi:hypothetical protein